MTRAFPVKIRHLLYVKGNICIAFLYHNFFLPFDIVVKVEHKGWKSCCLWIAYGDMFFKCWKCGNQQADCEVYDEGAMIGRNVQKWCQLFKEGWMNVHDERSLHLSLVNAKIWENTIYSLSISRKFWPARVWGVTMRWKMCRTGWKAWQWLFWWRHTKAGPMVQQMP